MGGALDVNLMSFSVMCTSRQMQAWISNKEGGKPNWQERQRLINQVVRKKDYDFLCFQHVGVDGRARFNSQFYLLKKFESFATIYPDASNVDEIEDFVPIFYNVNRWVLDPTDHGVVWFDFDLPERQKHSIGGQVFSYGLFHNKSELITPFYVYNARLRNCSDQVFLLKCVDQLRQHIESKDYPVILAIDTQGNEKSKIVKLLLGDDVSVNGHEFSGGSKLYDVLLTEHPSKFGKLRSQHNYNSPGDMSGGGMNDRFVMTPGFYTNSVSLNDYHEGGVYPSYHYPVDVNVSLFPSVCMDLLYKLYLCRKPIFREQQGHLSLFLRNKNLDEVVEARVRAILSSKEYNKKKKSGYECWDEGDRKAFLQVREKLEHVGCSPLTSRAMSELEALMF